MPQELTPPPQSIRISTDAGNVDSAWFAWFQEVWDKSRQGFQGLQSVTISSNETLEVDLSSKLSGFKDYKIVFNNVLVSQPNTLLYVRISKDAGATYKSGNADYSWIVSLSGETSKKIYDNEDSQMQLVDAGLGNAASNIVTGEIIFYDLTGSSSIKFFRWDLRYKDADDKISLVRGAGSYNDSGAINGIKLYPSNGKFSSGELEIFGAK